MSALKGFDRISLVLAIIAIVPGAYIGFLLDQDFRKTATPEYEAWENKYDETMSMFKPLPPRRWKYPSAWVSAMGGLLVSGSIFFVVVLFSVRGTIHGTTHLYKWIDGELENIISKVNLNQKVIIGISVGLILFIITYAIAQTLAGGGAFYLGKTWFVWIIFVTIVGYFEYKLFS